MIIYASLNKPKNIYDEDVKKEPIALTDSRQEAHHDKLKVNI